MIRGVDVHHSFAVREDRLLSRPRLSVVARTREKPSSQGIQQNGDSLGPLSSGDSSFSVVDSRRVRLGIERAHTSQAVPSQIRGSERAASSNPRTSPPPSHIPGVLRT